MGAAVLNHVEGLAKREIEERVAREQRKPELQIHGLSSLSTNPVEQGVGIRHDTVVVAPKCYVCHQQRPHSGLETPTFGVKGSIPSRLPSFVMHSSVSKEVHRVLWILHVVPHAFGTLVNWAMNVVDGCWIGNG